MISPNPPRPPLHLFDAYGVELEYMIVDATTLDVLPVADLAIGAVAGPGANEFEGDEIGWSNELVLHVLEFKTNGPAASLAPLPALFRAEIARANDLLRAHGARLLPTGMHPWMDPHTQTRLWPHENGPIYLAYDRIFDCRGHGWSNLQSTHLNLPFTGDDEFARLHAAIRLVLPLLPALAASSPVVEGRVAGPADARLETYRHNQRRVPSVCGRVIPEPVFSEAAYRADILGRMYHDIAPHDPDGILQHEWLNSRGAIARFERGAIEIRVLDIQECPSNDLAILELVVATVRALVEERWAGAAATAQRAWEVAPLADHFLRVVREADAAPVEDAAYLRTFGIEGGGSGATTAGEVWRHLADELLPRGGAARARLETIFTQGALARRLVAATGPEPTRDRLRAVYGALADCLDRDATFTPEMV